MILLPPIALLLCLSACRDDGGVKDSDPTRDTGSDPDTVLVQPSLHNTVLGRPTDASIAVSVLADLAGDAAWVEYGTALDSDSSELAGEIGSTRTVTSVGGEPLVFDVTGLKPDTKYYYRVHFQPGGVGDDPDNLHSFHTQRGRGSTFHFGVQGDTHPERYNDKMFNGELFGLTMARRPTARWLSPIAFRHSPGMAGRRSTLAPASATSRRRAGSTSPDPGSRLEPL